MENDRIKRCIRVLNWSHRHPQEWAIICGTAPRGGALDEQTFTRIAAMLLAEGLDEIFLVLYTRFSSLHDLP